MYNVAFLNDIASCLKCVDVNWIVESSKKERMKAAKTHLTRRLAQKLLALPKHVRHNFVWAACRDNIDSFAQIIALLGHLADRVVARLTADLNLRPHL